MITEVLLKMVRDHNVWLDDKIFQVISLESDRFSIRKVSVDSVPGLSSSNFSYGLNRIENLQRD